jgi:hypothetical protein
MPQDVQYITRTRLTAPSFAAVDELSPSTHTNARKKSTSKQYFQFNHRFIAPIVVLQGHLALQRLTGMLPPGASQLSLTVRALHRNCRLRQ